MSAFETALKFWWGPLSGGGSRRLTRLPHSKSAPGKYCIRTITIRSLRSNVSPHLSSTSKEDEYLHRSLKFIYLPNLIYRFFYTLEHVITKNAIERHTGTESVL